MHCGRKFIEVMIRNFIHRLYDFLAFWGFNLRTFSTKWRAMRWYRQDFQTLREQQGQDTSFAWGIRLPMLGERHNEAGTTKGQYFHQDLYVARLIYAQNPAKHLDIGSRLDGFVAHLAVFRQVEVMDIRPLESSVPTISFRQADLMQLPTDMLGYCDSISSLHAIEHFGLGRYGDSIDYWGYLKAIENITKMLRKGGIFYFSVPIGKQRIEFNAHRVFAIAYLLEVFAPHYNLESFAYIDDKGDFFENITLDQHKIATNCGCHYGCGIFVWRKK